MTNCVTTEVLFGTSWWTFGGHSLSVKRGFQACVLDLIRQRSVVQVHLGPPDLKWIHSQVS